MISWVIWNARNKLHFEKTQVPPKVIFDGAVGFLEEYQKLMIAQRVAQAFFSHVLSSDWAMPGPFICVHFLQY